MAIRYVVKDEHTLGCIAENSNLMAVLAGSGLKGGHDHFNGPVAIVFGHTNIRPATKEDFDTFRVVVPPDF